MRSDGGRGRRWTAGTGGGGLGLRERDAGEELAAGTQAHGCGGGDVGARMRRRERWDMAARDAARAQGAEAARAGERGRTGGGVRERLREDAGDGLRVHCGVLGL